MQNALKWSVAGIAALVFVAVTATSHQQNSVSQQDAEYSAQTQSAGNIFQADSVSAEPSEADFNRYNLEYCAMVNHEYNMLQQGYDVPAKKARLIRSEKKKCIEVWTAYRKIHPSGSIVTTTIEHPRLF